MNSEAALLQVRDLVIGEARGVSAPIVRGVSFDVAHEETLGIVGESGSGKTLTLRAVLDLLPEGVERRSGAIRFQGKDLAQMSKRELRSVRGSGVGIVFQEPMTALNPLMRVGAQIVEARIAHFGEDKSVARQKAVELLDQVGVRNPRERARSYVHELSGGMRQRALIAQALACEPSLLLCDEPTTALDVVVQRQVIDLLMELKRSLHLSIVFVSHDLSLVSEFCDTIAVMYSGEIVEYGQAMDVVLDPAHPYVLALLNAIPNPDIRAARLEFIPGSPPAPSEQISGCRFAARCTFATDKCTTAPVELERRGTARQVRCLYPRDSIHKL